jgi:hypothetical protein
MKKRLIMGMAVVMLSALGFSSTAMADWDSYEADQDNSGSTEVQMKDTSWACALRRVEMRNNEDNDEMTGCFVHYVGSTWYLRAYVQSGSDADVRCKAICSKF